MSQHRRVCAGFESCWWSEIVSFSLSCDLSPSTHTHTRPISFVKHINRVATAKLLSTGRSRHCFRKSSHSTPLLICYSGKHICRDDACKNSHALKTQDVKPTPKGSHACFIYLLNVTQRAGHCLSRDISF